MSACVEGERENERERERQTAQERQRARKHERERTSEKTNTETYRESDRESAGQIRKREGRGERRGKGKEGREKEICGRGGELVMVRVEEAVGQIHIRPNMYDQIRLFQNDIGVLGHEITLYLMSWHFTNHSSLFTNHSSLFTNHSSLFVSHTIGRF